MNQSHTKPKPTLTPTHPTQLNSHQTKPNPTQPEINSKRALHPAYHSAPCRGLALRLLPRITNKPDPTMCMPIETKTNNPAQPNPTHPTAHPHILYIYMYAASARRLTCHRWLCKRVNPKADLRDRAPLKPNTDRAQPKLNHAQCKSDGNKSNANQTEVNQNKRKPCNQNIYKYTKKNLQNQSESKSESIQINPNQPKSTRNETIKRNPTTMYLNISTFLIEYECIKVLIFMDRVMQSTYEQYNSPPRFPSMQTMYTFHVE